MIRSSLLLALCVLASSYASHPTYSTQPIETRRTRYHAGPIQTKGYSTDETPETRTRYHAGPIRTRANVDDLEASAAEERKVGDIVQDNAEARRVHFVGPRVEARRNVHTIHSRRSFDDGDFEARKLIWPGVHETTRPRSLEVEERKFKSGFYGPRSAEMLEERKNYPFYGPRSAVMLEERKNYPFYGPRSAELLEERRKPDPGFTGPRSFEVEERKFDRGFFGPRSAELLEQRRKPGHGFTGPLEARSEDNEPVYPRSFELLEERKRPRLGVNLDARKMGTRDGHFYGPRSLEIEERKFKSGFYGPRSAEVLEERRKPGHGFTGPLEARNEDKPEARRRRNFDDGDFEARSLDVEERRRLSPKFDEPFRPRSYELLEERKRPRLGVNLDTRRMGTRDGHFYGPRSLEVEERRIPVRQSPIPIFNPIGFPCIKGPQGQCLPLPRSLEVEERRIPVRDSPIPTFHPISLPCVKGLQGHRPHSRSVDVGEESPETRFTYTPKICLE